MKRFRVNIFILAAILSYLVMALPTSVAVGSQPAGIKGNVTITNTPLPVQGTVNANVVNTVPTSITSTAVTHMGRSPEEHVTLGVAGGTGDLCTDKGPGWNGFSRRSQDNTFGSFFVVPNGKALILTDFGIGVIKPDGATWSVGDLLTARLERDVDFTTVWQTSITLNSSTSAATRVWINGHVISGVVFRAGQRPCIKVGIGLEADEGANNSSLSIVHGYLLPE